MIKKILGVAAGLGLAAFGTGALAAGMVMLGNRRVREWETLTEDDASEGAYLTLSNGTRIHYIARGDASANPGREPLILIHGLMDSAHSWYKNIDVLAQDRRVLAIDLIGFGYSSRVAEPTYSLNYFAQTVREFMDAMNIERASIVGHSLGGAVTLELARLYPERVNKLVLIAPGTYLVNLLTPIQLAARVPIAPRAFLGLTMTNERARMRAWRRALGDPARMNPQEKAMRVRPAQVKGTVDALVAMAASEWTSDLVEEMRAITAPTLILWGDKDHAVPLRHGDRHARALPNAEYVILEGAGHIPHVEFADAVNQLMIDFMKK